jgi:hypothetical protein
MHFLVGYHFSVIYMARFLMSSAFQITLDRPKRTYIHKVMLCRGTEFNLVNDRSQNSTSEIIASKVFFAPKSGETFLSSTAHAHVPLRRLCLRTIHHEASCFASFL